MPHAAARPGAASRALDSALKVSEQYGGTYRTTPRYQVQMRELAAERTFAELLAHIRPVYLAQCGIKVNTVSDRSAVGHIRNVGKRVRAGIPCPSAADPGRNPHRTGTGWTLGTVTTILSNPRYTGHQVWNGSGPTPARTWPIQLT
jgi:hypothetical protein